MPEEDRAFATRLARYGARNPVALERLACGPAAKAVTYRSDKSEGPTAGTEATYPPEFRARVLTHIPDKGQVTARYCVWLAKRSRGPRGEAAPATADGPPAIVSAPRLAPTEAARRWAALLDQIFKVDPLACHACHGAVRLVAFITETSVINQILTHLRTCASREAHARPPTRRRSPEDGGPDAPPPRGPVGVRGGPTATAHWFPPASLPPLGPPVPRPLRAHERVGGPAADRQSARPLAPVARSARRRANPPRSKVPIGG